MDLSHHWFHHKNYLLVLFFLLLNVLFIDLFVGINLFTKATVSPTAIPNTNSQVDPGICSSSCLAAINEAVAPLKITPSPTSHIKNKQTMQPTTVPVQNTPSSQNDNSVKEYFIPLGSGSSTSSDWTDVVGVKAEIDSAKYSKINKILFETSVHVQNANEIVEIRLYNETDKYIVGNSEILYPSSTTQNFRIAEIQFGQGSKIYKVQMKTQLQYTAILDQARIHITTY